MAIRWPERFEPDRCPVHVRNELEMSAPAAAVWAWLVRVEAWPSWYANASDVRVDGESSPDLSAGARFFGELSASGWFPPWKSPFPVNGSTGVPSETGAMPTTHG